MCGAVIFGGGSLSSDHARCSIPSCSMFTFQVCRQLYTEHKLLSLTADGQLEVDSFKVGFSLFLFFKVSSSFLQVSVLIPILLPFQVGVADFIVDLMFILQTFSSQLPSACACFVREDFMLEFRSADQHGSTWIKMDHDGSTWINGSTWIKIDKKWIKWIKRDQNGSTLIKIRIFNLTARFCRDAMKDSDGAEALEVGGDATPLPHQVIPLEWCLMIILCM